MVKFIDVRHHLVRFIEVPFFALVLWVKRFVWFNSIGLYLCKNSDLAKMRCFYTFVS